MVARVLLLEQRRNAAAIFAEDGPKPPHGMSLIFGSFNQLLVELKNGETYNGHLVSCDSWMNINLRDVICTSKDGDRFWRMPECYIRGSTIKYLRIPDEVIDMVKEDAQAKSRNRAEMNKGGRSGGGAGGGGQNQNQRGRGGNRNSRNPQGSGGNPGLRPGGPGNRPLAQNNKNRK